MNFPLRTAKRPGLAAVATGWSRLGLLPKARHVLVIAEHAFVVTAPRRFRERACRTRWRGTDADGVHVGQGERVVALIALTSLVVLIALIALIAQITAAHVIFVLAARVRKGIALR